MYREHACAKVKLTYYPDPNHLEDTERFLTIGECDQNTLLIVPQTHRSRRVRFISARDAR